MAAVCWYKPTSVPDSAPVTLKVAQANLRQGYQLDLAAAAAVAATTQGSSCHWQGNPADAEEASTAVASAASQARPVGSGSQQSAVIIGQRAAAAVGQGVSTVHSQ